MAQILNPNAEGKRKYFTPEGKTTIENLRMLKGDSYVDIFTHISELVIPETLLEFLFTEELIEETIERIKVKKRQEYYSS